MIALITDNIEAIQNVCRKHHVRSLYVFGSAVDELAFDYKSDVDFLYEIDVDNFKGWDTGDYDYLDNLIDLEFSLGKLLSKKVDLVSYQNIHNGYFKEVVDSSRQVVYDSGQN